MFLILTFKPKGIKNLKDRVEKRKTKPKLSKKCVNLKKFYYNIFKISSNKTWNAVLALYLKE